MNVRKRRISVTTGTRSEYGILRPILCAISNSKKLELQLIVTGMHLSKKHGFTINQIKKDGFKIAAKIPMIPKEDSKYFISRALGEALVSFSGVFSKLKPDINLVLGDRDEMLASAIAAYHMNIPNAHIHGGDKSGGIDEYTRHAITKISNIHFAASNESKKRIIKMGENPTHVFLTGSPSIDEIVQNKISSKKFLESKYKINLTGNEIILVYHPVTTQIEKTKKQISNILDAIVKIGNTTIAISPNSDASSNLIFRSLDQYSKKYRFIKKYVTLPREDYLGMLKNCGVLVGNSSSGMVEASYFNISVVNIGIRQKKRERGRNVFDVKDDSTNSIYHTVLKALESKRKRAILKQHVFGDGHASKKITNYLEKLKLNEKLIQKQIRY